MESGHGTGRGEVVMSKFIFFILYLFCARDLSAQYKTIMHKMYSQNVKDSFEIYVSVPEKYSAGKKYDVVYYCDANLKSGKELREQVEPNEKLGKTIFVGIGHIGNYHVLRRRDFILPFINKNDTVPKSDDYGHVKDFYNFLTKELSASIESSYHCSNKRTILGHSLGGLFAFYCLFQNEEFFTNYIALSPALWIDDYSIYDFNKISTGLSHKTYLYFSAGSQETLNKILAGTNKMDEFLKIKSYSNLSYEYEVHKGKTHNSQVPESLKHILDKL